MILVDIHDAAVIGDHYRLKPCSMKSVRQKLVYIRPWGEPLKTINREGGSKKLQPLIPDTWQLMRISSVPFHPWDILITGFAFLG